MSLPLHSEEFLKEKDTIWSWYLGGCKFSKSVTPSQSCFNHYADLGLLNAIQFSKFDRSSYISFIFSLMVIESAIFMLNHLDILWNGIQKLQTLTIKHLTCSQPCQYKQTRLTEVLCTLSKGIFLVKMLEKHYSNLIIYHPLLKGVWYHV